ncbi:MAG: hypothetical protein JXR49_00195 [Acidobacteria bacterium]|nr:hypothetical protein [Acidobacteriota bacterium]
MLRISRHLLSAIFSVFAVTAVPAVSQDFSAQVCEVVIYDENVELEDSRIAVDLARSDFNAYQKIFRMIEGLWEGKTIPRMDYIQAKYDQDAARLELERAGLILERQAALVEQYRLICNVSDSDRDAREKAIREAYLRYRRADCDSKAKSIEVAATNLEFNREYLKSILDLKKEHFATDVQVILAELDVELEEKSLTDARRRTRVCRAELDDLARVKE